MERRPELKGVPCLHREAGQACVRETGCRAAGHDIGARTLSDGSDGAIERRPEPACPRCWRDVGMAHDALPGPAHQTLDVTDEWRIRSTTWAAGELAGSRLPRGQMPGTVRSWMARGTSFSMI